MGEKRPRNSGDLLEGPNPKVVAGAALHLAQRPGAGASPQPLAWSCHGPELIEDNCTLQPWTCRDRGSWNFSSTW